MDLLVNAVACTTRQMVPTAVVVPKIVWSAFNGVFFVHRVWRWMRWGNVYKNPDNFFKLATGHALNFAVGGSVITRASAQCVLIAARIMECIDKQNAFVRSFEKLMDALKGNYPACPKREWTIRPPGGFVSPSTYSNLKIHILDAFNYTARVAKRIYKLAKSAFKLSMHMMDAVYAFSMSPSSGNEAVNQLFVNGTKSLDLLVDHKEELLQKLINNRALLDTIFKKIGSNYQTDNFIGHVSKTLQLAKSAQQTVKKIDRVGNGVFKDLGKQGLFGILGGLGLAQFTPHFLIPSRDAPWESEIEEPRERFAPIDWVTRTDVIVLEESIKPSEPMYIKEFIKGQFVKYVEVTIEKTKENIMVEAPPVTKRAFKSVAADTSQKFFKFDISKLWKSRAVK